MDNGKANQTGSCFLGHDLCGDEIGTWISIDSDFPNGCSWSITTTISVLAYKKIQYNNNKQLSMDTYTAAAVIVFFCMVAFAVFCWVRPYYICVRP